MKKIVFFISIVAISLSSCFKEKEEILKVYGWESYITEEIANNFYQETGITIQYDEFYSNETMFNEISTGEKVYDVIIPTDYIIERMINSDLLHEINHSLLTNYDKIFLGLTKTSFDKEGLYNVPFMWGTIGVVYNKSMMETPDSWEVLLDEKFKGEILMYDSMREIMTFALKSLGYSLNSDNLLELEFAKELLSKQKSLVKGYYTRDIIDAMVNEEGTLALAASGDAVAMSKRNSDIGYFVPKEGSRVWIDSFVIPKNTNNYKNAHLFIDYMSKPSVAKIISEKTGYTTANEDAIKIIDEELLYSDGYNIDLNPTNMEVYTDLEPEILEAYNSVYQSIFE